ncbi:XRE family transcriptional regulator [Bacillus infantis]|uniref:helix-turn-helix domain-containing protein n=1 Tax=Bacillus infantis TaxID=324767 RepID=UPI00101C65E4|nr:helix-turn-helix transcriptional regulator [Bacillus infantis]RYI28279.1 XRE family transcriptional regulator [Bacillus infantis]
MDITFGELVHTKRELVGLSMRELARRTSVDVAYISKIEKGQASNPNFSVVMRIAKELGINMETLQEVFQLKVDIGEVIKGEIHKSVSGADKEAIQGIVEGIVGVTDASEFDIEGIGTLLQKVYTLHQNKHKQQETYYVITVEEKEWVHVLQTPVVDSQLLTLYHQAMETNENNAFIIKGEIIAFPDYFSEHQVITLKDLLNKCDAISDNDDLYIPYSELKEYIEQLLHK